MFVLIYDQGVKLELSADDNSSFTYDFAYVQRPS